MADTKKHEEPKAKKAKGPSLKDLQEIESDLLAIKKKLEPMAVPVGTRVAVGKPRCMTQAHGNITQALAWVNKAKEMD